MQLNNGVAGKEWKTSGHNDEVCGFMGVMDCLLKANGRGTLSHRSEGKFKELSESTFKY